MKLSERLNCLQADIDRLVARYGQEAVHYKKTALSLKILSVFLAALITIFLGLKLQNIELKDWLGNAALVLGSVITVLSAYEAFFDPKALWIRETVTFARLKDLQRDIRFWASGLDSEAIDEKMLEIFKVRLDRILDDSLKYWMKVRGAPDLESKPQPVAEPKHDAAPRQQAP